MIPHLVSIFRDENANVRSMGLKALTQVVGYVFFLPHLPDLQLMNYYFELQLLLIKSLTPSNASIFPEYILPNTKFFSTDSEISVRITYAQCIAPLAKTAIRFLEMTEAMKMQGTFKSTNVHEFDGVPYEVSFRSLFRY